MVLFGEQGLVILGETEEKLAQVQVDVDKIQQKNKELRLKLKRLKSRPEEIEILAGEVFNQTQEGSTLYVFSSEE